MMVISSLFLIMISIWNIIHSNTDLSKQSLRGKGEVPSGCSPILRASKNKPKWRQSVAATETCSHKRESAARLKRRRSRSGD
jgi:hypothetical protein